jgi:N-acetylmuramoyl-L-alanine amidase
MMNHLPPLTRPCCALLTLLAATLSANAQGTSLPHIQDVRFWSFGDITRIVVQTQGNYKLTSDQIENPSRVYFDLAGLRPSANSRLGLRRLIVHDRRVKEIRIAQVSAGKTRIVFDLTGPAEVNSSQLVNPDRLIIEIRPKGTTLAGLSARRSAPAAPEGRDPSAMDRAVSLPNATTNATLVRNPLATATPAPVDKLPSAPTKIPSPPVTIVNEPAVLPEPTPILAPTVVPPPTTNRLSDTASPAKTDSEGVKSLVRIFGLKMGKVVIDAGHGGHDTGTIGPNGLMEKDLVLDVALRVGKLINQRLGATVVYTRADDTFIPLEQRTKIANDEKADLFISIHANSSPEPSATGVETYFFNLTSDKSGLDLATRENATSASSISDLNDLLHKAVLQTKKEESREFAQDVQSALWMESVKMNSRSRDRGVRQAPFVVLIGAGMPSVLAEVGFVSNSHDERLLKRSDERQRIAEALFKGISQYANSLSHLQVARTE